MHDNVVRGARAWLRENDCAPMTLALALALVTATGCSDVTVYGGECASGTMTIGSPGPNTVLGPQDDLSEAPGHQSNVEVYTSFAEGTELSLSFVTPAGEMYVWPHRASATVGGSALFANVTFPVGPATLRVHHQGACALQSESVEIRTLGPLPCALDWAVRPVSSDWYQPYGVINQAHDGDPTAAGAQTELRIASSPGSEVQLWDSAGGGKTQVAQGVVGSSGTLKVVASLSEGEHALRASCSVKLPPEQTVSQQWDVLVDTIAPDCAFDTIVNNQVVSKRHDQDPVKDGTQIAVVASYHGSDVEGQPVLFTVQHQDELFLRAGSPVDAGKTVATVMFWAPGANDVRASAADRAGNGCRASALVHYLP